MERLIKINSKILEKKPGVDQFAVQQIFKNLNPVKEYLINSQWSDNTQGRIPEEKRLLLSKDEFYIARNSYKAWKLLSANEGIYDVVNKEKVIQRIIEAQVKADSFLNLFIPWGIRPQGSFGNSEIKVLDRIKTLYDKLNSLFRIKVLLMPADIYASEINNVDTKLVNQYVANIMNEGESRNFNVVTWSSIRNENRQEYDELASKLNENEIKKTLSASVIYSALNAAKNRSGRSSSLGIKNAAFSYLQERLCEADIIEEKYRPIKVSAVAKNKDNEVDRALPRVYIIPLEEQFPWLK